MNSQQLAQFYKEHKSKGIYKGWITYENHAIAQWHNPNILIKELHGENQTKQFTSVQIIGSPGTGKTTLATTIAHGIHTRDPNYLVFHFGKHELLRFDTVLDSLPTDRDLILIFDDVSLAFKLISGEQKTKILQALTEARHPKLEKTDRKVIIISITHYGNALEKLVRSQGSWKFFTDMNNEEQQNFNAITKGYFKNKVDGFARTVLDQFRKGEFKVNVTANKFHTYKINDPFRFVMYFDNSRVRFALVPAHSCNLCSKDKKQIKKTQATPDEIIQLAQKYYANHGIAGLKLALLTTGQTAQYQNQVIYSYNTCKEILSSFDINLEQLAQRMRERAQIRGTRLYTIRKKKTDFVADLEKIRNKTDIEPISNDIEPEEIKLEEEQTREEIECI